MSCVHRTKHRVELVQEEIQGITSDRSLFRFLKDQFNRHRGRYLGVVATRRVRQIFFVKVSVHQPNSSYLTSSNNDPQFFLHRRKLVEIRHHHTSCEAGCECLPPETKKSPPIGDGEYFCKTPIQPRTWPPVCPEFMMHMLHEPDCFEEDDTWIFDLLPKRTQGKLQAASDPVDGWGIYYQEDLDISGIIGVVFIILFMASLLFLILWTVLKDDIQGASGVSAYIVAVASMTGIWIATKSRSFG